VAKHSVAYQYDWPRTRAFCLGAAGDVWLNVRGRDPEGVVEPGAEYEEVRERIRDTFLALRDARSGAPVVEGVHFREEVYQGPFLDRAPDLTIRFADVVIETLALNGKTLRLPRRAAATPKEVKTGGHRPDGLAILAGDGIRAGATLAEARLVDLAPTILYWLGQPVPTYMDGRILSEAFTPEHLAAQPPQQVDREAVVGAREAGYSAEEAAVVLERLRGLGYV
jgi:predicted AlkP superfamily phosphohydrolase/phosphomutase